MYVNFQFHHPPHVGINPRGLIPLKLWQMDVTHISQFGNIKYAHVSVDTCSGIIHATLMTGEKARNAISHCLETWAAWGKPDSLKTDNRPAYTAKSFQAFCQTMQVGHTTGLPYNPQGQGIEERVHCTLKELIQKQKEGIASDQTPREQLSLALFTLHFLILDVHGCSATDCQATTTPITNAEVKWKDVLTDEWRGPDPMISRSRGAICVFPQNQGNPIWVPKRLTCLLLFLKMRLRTLLLLLGMVIQVNSLTLWAIARSWPVPMPVHSKSTVLPTFFFQWVLSNEQGAYTSLTPFARLMGKNFVLYNVSATRKNDTRLTNIQYNNLLANNTATSTSVCVRSPFFFLISTNVSSGVLNCNSSDVVCYLAECWDGTNDTAVMVKIPSFVPIPVEANPDSFSILNLLRAKRDFGIMAVIISAIVLSAAAATTAAITMTNQIQMAETVRL
ncbi:uncharacterized protein LOC134481269 [Rattus norvegicus]|uniref:uncharacterized protein LOC134481269 n=1 Tax=Rattus norvegicus TaxID=10116 RepID=UPI002FD7EFBD